MGLNSGEVVVGKIGDDLRMDYTAQGHTVGLAQRMEQLAEPGSVYLTEHTARPRRRATSRCATSGTFTVKGASEPLRVYELEGLGALRTRLDVSRARGFSRFVGRADEMAVLEAALERSAARDTARRSASSAEAGTGKSRLCYEFVERCRARGLTVIEAHGVAHGQNDPVAPDAVELLRGSSAISEHDAERRRAREDRRAPAAARREPARGCCRSSSTSSACPTPRGRCPRWIPRRGSASVFAAVRAIVRARRPAGEAGVVLFEDLHWLDAASDALLRADHRGDRRHPRPARS